jgi:hypothetical protein
MAAEYGARRPGGTGTVIELGAGQRLTNVTLRMSKYGAITGVIYDQNGEPAPNVSVEALRYTMRTGRRTLSSVYGQPSTTDDRGMYRLAGLGPGQYYVAAGPSPSRGPLDVQVLTTADVDRVLQALAAGSGPASTTFTQPHQGFAPVFFPGAPEFARAQPIVLAFGEERADINIRLQLVPTARIDGTVLLPDGRPLTSGQVVATAVTDAYSMDLFSGTLGNAALDPQGRFAFPAVPPGRFVITVRGANAAPAATGATSSGSMWASADVNMNGADLNVSLVMQPGMTVSGKVIFNGATLPPPTNPGIVRVGLVSTQPESVSIGVASVNVSAAGTFTLTGVAPGQYQVSSSTPPSPAGWALRSAVLNGIDALDMPFVVEPGQSIDNAVITFTDQPTELAGTLQGASGTPTADYFIVVFATNRAFWTPNARRSVTARPASTGRYLVRNLPPGEYFVAAVTDVEFGDWWDQDFLASLAKPETTRITLAEGEKKVLDLKIGATRYAPFVADGSFGYFVRHVADLRGLTLLMTALGGGIAFYGPFRSRSAVLR